MTSYNSSEEDFGRNICVAMPLMNTPFSLGHCMDAVQQIQDVDYRNIALAEYYYFTGNSDKASALAEPYLYSDDIALRVSACWLCAYANLALDRTERTQQIITRMQEYMKDRPETVSPMEMALTECVSTAAAVLLHLPLSKVFVPLKEYLHMLPPGLKLFVLYIQAHYSYLNKRYGACIGIAETALALEREIYPIPTIYLHLVAAMGYINFKQSEYAKEHLLEAWKLAQSDGLIEPFGEHHGLLGGMLETVFKKAWPEDFNRMIAITYEFSAGWRKLHNAVTGNTVANDLTTTEFTVAMLAARGWTNKEISAHLGTSVNTVKLQISSALQKLGISQRKELIRFMLK